MRLILWLFAALLLTTDLPAVELPGEGADRAIAGEGQEPGRFSGILDITFDAKGRLYVLEFTTKDPKRDEYTGGARVQILERSGKVVSSFSVVDEVLVGEKAGDKPGEKDTPTHLAVDAAGRIYVTKPFADRVQRYVDGKPDHAFTVSGATALAVGQIGGHETLAVSGSLNAVINGKWTWVAGENLTLIDPATEGQRDVVLPHRLYGVKDLTVSPMGTILVLGCDFIPDWDHGLLVFEFAADGSLKRTLGLGGKTRIEDGSELKHSIAADRAGRIYAMTWGNPGRVVRFDADGGHLSTRPGQFAWAVPWSTHSSYCALAVDPDDRLWLASTCRRGDKERDQHPAILRVRSNFFEEEGREVKRLSTRQLGFRPEIRTDLPYDIAYEPGAITARVVFPAGRRSVTAATATWRAYDADKREVGKGTMSFALDKAEEVAAALSFTAPQFGWYLVECDFTSDGEPLGAIAKAIGITPKFPGLPVLAQGDAVGGWEDTARSVFCGLPNMRLHPDKYKGRLDELVKLAERAKRDGATVVVQFFEGKDKIDIPLAREVVTRLKGIVTYYELVNEPNFTMSPEELAALAKELTPAAKSIDPTIEIMGPTVCGLDLGWNKRFFEAGGAKYIDIVAVHDYEGHESISPEHWRWKFGELRKLMAQYGIGDLPIWQTERAISVIRGGLLTPMAQAARLTLQSDVLETLGIPREHNNHYYLNEGGYDSVPSYVWSATGPFPGALASRTRQAMVGGRRYDGQLDFGITGNDLFMGLRHVGGDGTTITLRNLGTIERPTEFSVSGDAVEVVDSWGNSRREAVKGGKLRLPLAQMPCYVRLGKGQTLAAPVIDYGHNIADTAVITYGGEYTGDLAWLTNGVIETFHGGNPNGGTGGERIWGGAPPTPSAPRVLELRWPSPRAIHRVLVQGVEADNGFCALVDYDVQVERSAGTWTTVDEVRLPLPPTDLVRTGKTLATTWYVRSNRFAHEFAPVETSAVRLLVRRTTFGFAPDETAVGAVKSTWGGCPPARVMLREVAVYAAPSATTLTVATSGTIPGRPALPATVTITTAGKAADAVALRLPAGWSAAPEQVALKGTTTATFALTPPAAVAAGALAIDAIALAGGKRVVTEAVAIHVSAPTEVRVEAVSAIDRAKQAVSARVKNRSGHALTGIAKLKLAGASQTVAEQAFGPLAPDASSTVTWQVPGLDLAATAVTAQVIVVADGITCDDCRALTMREWQVLGPFSGDERDAALVSGIEQGRIDLGGSYGDAVGTVRTWTPVRTVSGWPEVLDLARTIKAPAGSTAYAVMWVKSPTAQLAHLLLQGQDCSVHAWVETTAVAGVGADSTAPVQLKAGWNRLLLSSARTGNEWKITVGLRDAAGNHLTEVAYASKPAP
jgi:hypothetical protein